MGKIVVNKEDCKNCGLCMNVCPKGVIMVTEEVNAKGFNPVTMDETKECIGCALCATMCPEAAIEVYR